MYFNNILENITYSRTAVQSANQRITTSVNVPHLLRLASMNGSTLQNNCHCARGTWRASAAPNSGSRKRLERHFLLKEMYCQFMSEYISLNHMQINVDISQPHYLIPPLSEVTQKWLREVSPKWHISSRRESLPRFVCNIADDRLHLLEVS